MLSTVPFSFSVGFRRGGDHCVIPPKVFGRLYQSRFRGTPMWLFQAHGVVATAVKALAVDAAEVADNEALRSDVSDDLEFVHTFARRVNYSHLTACLHVTRKTAMDILANCRQALLAAIVGQIFCADFAFLASEQASAPQPMFRTILIQTRISAFVLVNRNSSSASHGSCPCTRPSGGVCYVALSSIDHVPRGCAKRHFLVAFQF